MILFIIIFVSFAFLSTILKFSLIENRPLQIAGIVLVSGYCLVVYPLCIKQNNQHVFEILQNKNIIHAIAALQIFESILMIAISLQYIKGHFSKSIKPFIALLSVIPSFVFLGGLYLFQLFLFQKITGMSFVTIAVLYAFITGLIVLFFMFVTKVIIKQWEVRVELKILIHFMQILLAMFLPLIVNEVKVPFSNLVTDTSSILIILSIILVFGLLGILEYKYLRKRKRL
ncbi:MAG: hypothetical protein JXB49_37205 [Bacteroidales bacterium]|nr:hypothetical protein [Bacteroidales bacterium]